MQAPPGERRGNFDLHPLDGWTFCPGDKVIQVENEYDRDVYSGDLGVVSRIDMEEGELHVDFDGREVIYGFGDGCLHLHGVGDDGVTAFTES